MLVIDLIIIISNMQTDTIIKRLISSYKIRNVNYKKSNTYYFYIYYYFYNIRKSNRAFRTGL